MEVLRRHTDYGLRAMVYLSTYYSKEPISVRELSGEGNFSYQLGCKLLQRLHKAKLVESHMGPKGGFALSREPSKITLLEIINALQGGIRLNRCLLDGDSCEFKSECGIHTKLACLQLYIDGYFGGITLEELLHDQTTVKKKMKN